MTYVSWAVLYEGNSDASYFDVLIPRLMEELVAAGKELSTIPLTPAIRFNRGAPARVAQEACDASDAFHLIFIHADTGGRSLERDIHYRGALYCEEMERLCGWQIDKCIVIAPRHETEAWILADPQAVTDTFGYSAEPEKIGLPSTARAAERLQDPKAALLNAAAKVRGRRRPIQAAQLYPAIAQRQSLAALRQLRSFKAFEERVCVALRDLHAI